MPASDDIPSLESWLRDKALEAHNKFAGYDEEQRRLALTAEERIAALCHMREYKSAENAFNETIAKIQSGRVSQRPHVREII